MKVMIVEDDARMCSVLVEMVGPLFSDIDVTGDGAEAVSQFEHGKPDVVLMDIRLPVMDGLEATERIMRDHPNARIFIVTSYNEQEYRERARRAGASGFFLKDDLGDLYDSLARYGVAS